MARRVASRAPADHLTIRTTEYLTFREEPTLGSTRMWSIISTKHGDILATIAWYGSWRQYTFRPVQGSIWNIGCLTEVNKFISEAMNDWRTKRRREVPTNGR